jgi:hypothetical protein
VDNDVFVYNFKGEVTNPSSAPAVSRFAIVRKVVDVDFTEVGVYLGC